MSAERKKIEPVDAIAWLERQIELSGYALDELDRSSADLQKSPEDKRRHRPSIIAEVTRDRWSAANPDVTNLVDAALSAELTRHVAEHLGQAKAWLQSRLNEHRKQLAHLTGRRVFLKDDLIQIGDAVVFP